MYLASTFKKTVYVKVMFFQLSLLVNVLMCSVSSRTPELYSKTSATIRFSTFTYLFLPRNINITITEKNNVIISTLK